VATEGQTLRLKGWRGDEVSGDRVGQRLPGKVEGGDPLSARRGILSAFDADFKKSREMAACDRWCDAGALFPPPSLPGC